MDTFKTFLRSARNFEEFASARKITQETGLTREEAVERCREYNKNRTAAQIKAGTKLEFESE